LTTSIKIHRIELSTLVTQSFIKETLNRNYKSLVFFYTEKFFNIFPQILFFFDFLLGDANGTREIREIEFKWQKRWTSSRLFEPKRDHSKKKFFIIFAYPGISGFLHIGHLRSYTYPDIIARYKRMRGFNVLFPAGIQPSGLPTVAFSMKVARKDPVIIEHLRNHGVSDEIIVKMMDPIYTVQFFRSEYMKMWLSMGFSIDTSRDICSIDPEYQRFIEWQFLKLNDKGLLIQKSHYIPYCPIHGPVAVDPSETDISKGGNAEIVRFTLIKFICNEYTIPIATLRPETIFGVTNIWINPEADYVGLRLDNEIWIISKDAAEKIKYQKENVEFTHIMFKGKDFIGKNCLCPLTGRKVPILPASFVNPSTGTGIVMSVPAHDPYDYITLEEIKMNGKWKEITETIKPITIIKTNKYREIPALECIRENKGDIEKAKQILYRLELSQGVMLDLCGEISGMPVNIARDKIRQILIEKGYGDEFYEFSEEVVCRCGSKVFIKRINDQWFIKYSDQKLKEKAHKCAENMVIKPDSYARNIHNIIDWYDDRACARKGRWLGTPLPFDQEWIIEPISDSTIYPAMYIISKYIHQKKISSEQLIPELLDFVFLGKGDPEKISEKTKIPIELLVEIRKDFEYWYPVDMNCGGKEHMSVHFPVYIFNHVAIFPEKYWPRGIFVNWWVIGKGGKISKSKGGAEPIPNLLEKYTADGIRLYYAHLASPHNDIIWDEKVAERYKRRIGEIYKTCQILLSIIKKKIREATNIDKWIISRTNRTIQEATQLMENYCIRDAAHRIFFEFHKDILWWLKRGGKDSYVAVYILDKWVRLMAPFTPHLAEEFWEKLGRMRFVSVSKWPEFELDKIDDKIEAEERYIVNTIEDINNIIKTTGKQPSKIYIYTAANWTWKIIDILKDNEMDIDNAVRECLTVISNIPKEKTMKIIRRILRLVPYTTLIKINETDVLIANREYLEKLFNARVYINDNYDPMNKKTAALPYKPAIHLE